MITQGTAELRTMDGVMDYHELPGLHPWYIMTRKRIPELPIAALKEKKKENKNKKHIPKLKDLKQALVTSMTQGVL